MLFSNTPPRLPGPPIGKKDEKGQELYYYAENLGYGILENVGSKKRTFENFVICLLLSDKIRSHYKKLLCQFARQRMDIRKKDGWSQQAIDAVGFDSFLEALRSAQKDTDYLRITNLKTAYNLVLHAIEKHEEDETDSATLIKRKDLLLEEGRYREAAKVCHTLQSLDTTPATSCLDYIEALIMANDNLEALKVINNTYEVFGPDDDGYVLLVWLDCIASRLVGKNNLPILYSVFQKALAKHRTPSWELCTFNTWLQQAKIAADDRKFIEDITAQLQEGVS